MAIAVAVLTMQSMVSGQAPITPEWKITSGGKTKKNTRSHPLTDTGRNRVPKTKRKGDICAGIIRVGYISLPRQFATETETGESE